MLTTPVVMLHEQSKTVLAQKKNGNAKKTKLSDSQIIKNLGVKKVANPSNDLNVRKSKKYKKVAILTILKITKGKIGDNGVVCS